MIDLAMFLAELKRADRIEQSLNGLFGAPKHSRRLRPFELTFCRSGHMRERSKSHWASGLVWVIKRLVKETNVGIALF